MADTKTPCAVTRAMEVIGGKWKILIVCRLHYGTKRFGELRKSLDGITTKMLTQQLRELEEDNIIHREVFKEVPPKVEYSLTEIGESLKPIILALSEWGTTLPGGAASCANTKKRNLAANQKSNKPLNK